MQTKLLGWLNKCEMDLAWNKFKSHNPSRLDLFQAFLYQLGKTDTAEASMFPWSISESIETIDHYRSNQ